ncbi:MAG: type I-E CRISPR-associated protein Cse1/CasA [Clostridiales bacterium]|nr:type I-E CRISPR-associated protein Cse1/CasA [Clostridiales bacterium]
MSFNVLTEPWIPVIKDGKGLKMGILGVLEHAHELSEVLCSEILETYSIQRLLIAFLIDAYQSAGKLETIADRQDLFYSGRFDMQVIHDYVKLCESEGTSFDLFDEKRPFMQNAFDPEIDTGKETKATKLFLTLPSGNNHIHFEHYDNGIPAFTLEQCLRGLLTAYCFAYKDGRGYVSSINGQPCYYFLIRGRNLFETLVLSMTAKSEISEQVCNMPVAWRQTDSVTPGREFPAVSLLAAYTWQPRRVGLIQDDDGLIRNVYLKPGHVFTGRQIWRDPHTAVCMNKKGEYSTLTPSEDRAFWRDVGSLTTTSGRNVQPTIIAQYRRFIEDSSVCPIEAFGMVTDQASLIQLSYDLLNIPSQLLEEVEKADRLNKDISFIEDISKSLKKVLKKMEHSLENKPKTQQTGKKKDKDSQLVNETVQKYFAAIHNYVIDEYFNLLGNADTFNDNWQNAVVASVNEKVKSETLSAFNEAKSSLGTNARQLQAQAGSEVALRKELKKHLERRKNK